MKRMFFPAVIVIVTIFSNIIRVSGEEASTPIYLGTYTRGADGAKGIYLTHLDTQTGSLSEPQLVAEVPNPSFLATHPKLPRLYSISEGGDGTSGNVHSFTIDPATFALTKLNEQTVPVRGACHLGVFPLPMMPDEPEKYAVMVAFYGEGAVASLPLTEDGQLAPYATIHKHVGSGPHPRQKQAHAHAVYSVTCPEPHLERLEAHAMFICTVIVVPDLGADKLFLYDRMNDGRLAPAGELKLPPGSGPRHAYLYPQTVFTPQTVFILNELNSTISVVTTSLVYFSSVAPPSLVYFSSVAPRAWEIVQTISTLPEGKVVENNTTAAIFMHPNKRFLYASNRGDDSIALFHFDSKKRQLAFVETVPCGKHPRSFDISPDGKWLIVAAMHDDRVATFRINPDTGRLTPTEHAITVKQPTCVLPVTQAEDKEIAQMLSRP